MDGISAALQLGAVLTGGWVSAFSQAGKDIGGLSRTMTELKKIGAKSFSFDGINGAESELKEAERALSKFQKQLKDKTPTANQERELNRLKKNVEDAGKKFDKAKDKVASWKKGLQKNFVDVNRAMLLVKRNDALDSLSKKLSKLRTIGGSVLGGLKSFGLSIFGQTSAIVASTAIVSDWGDTMAKTAQRLGMFDAEGTENVEMLQRMQWAALQANIENEQFVKYLDDMTRRIGQAAAGMGESGKALEQLGLSAKALSGMGADKQFETIVNAFGKIENATERVRLAGMIWGEEAARKMPNLIARGMTQIRADMDNATNYIVTGNKQIVDSCGTWDTQMKILRATWNSVFRSTILTIMPSVTEAMGSLSSVISENREKISEFAEKTSSLVIPVVSWLSKNLDDLFNITSKCIMVFSAWKLGSFIASLWNTGTAIVSAAKGFWAFTKTLNFAAISQKACAAATVIWQGVTIAMTAAQWALNAALSANPIGVVVAAIAAAVAAIAGIAYLIYDNWEPISEFFSGLWENLKTGFFSVVDWVKSGFTAAWNWLKNSAIFKAITEVIEWFSDLGGDDVPVPEPASVPISGTELETMTRAAVSNSNSVRTDARTFHTNANISIVQQPGEDSDALAQRVSARLADSYGNFSAATI